MRQLSIKNFEHNTWGNMAGPDVLHELLLLLMGMICKT